MGSKNGGVKLRVLHTAARFARNYVTKHSLFTWEPGTIPKFNKTFRAFLTHQGIQNDHLSKQQLTKLMYKLWCDRDFETFGRTWDVNFYTSQEWMRLRREILKKYGRVCMKCQQTENIAVDHIKPRSIFPDLRLDPENMQVLCRSCNSSKSNRRYVDYRGLPAPAAPANRQHPKPAVV